MKMSFNRRRSIELHSLPPERARSPRVVIIAGLLLSATVALAASQMGRSAPAPADDPAAEDAEARTERMLDERVRLHLRSLR